MGKRVDSDSRVQREIELLMLKKIRERLNDTTLESKRILLGDGKQFIHPDFYSEENRTVGEIHAHIGRLKGSQPGKIAKDILKMLLVDDIYGCKYHKFIAVCDKEEYQQLKGDSYLARSIRQHEIEVLLIDDLDKENMARLKESMKKQNLLAIEDN